MKLFKSVLVAILTVVISLAGCNGERQQGEPLTKEQILNESDEAFDRRMEWWRDATFGLFIHWGPYAVPAGVYEGEQVGGTAEWIMNTFEIPVTEYEQYARQFNPVDYDADEWVKMARDAGMKYIIITSKHHDGFGLWDSEVSGYDAVDFAAIHSDLLAELREACDRHGMKLGFYYSIMDWHHPDAQAAHYPDYNTGDKSNPNFDRYVENYLKPQVRELMENYDPAVMWFDGEWIPEWTHEHGVEIYTMLRQMKPDLIINNRVDVGRQGMQGMNEAGGDYVGDFGTPEQEILENTSEFDWEACMTMNDTWGYNKLDDNWKSTETLVHNLVDITAKGGNYLLNVGPTAEGLIPEASVERLREMGDWMDVNGEAIYETERLENHFRQGENVRYTKKKGEPVYYGITFEEPGESVNFNYLRPEADSEVILLGHDEPLEWEFSEDHGLIVHVPESVKNSPGFGPAWTFRVRGSELPDGS